ncbi:MAG: hypothetical protein KH020_18320 [Clostridiales bacterium]|nr:hypothetical protein [Clostridiales bacterium]
MSRFNESTYTMLLPSDTDPEILDWLQTQYLYPYFRFNRVYEDHLCKYLQCHMVYHVYADDFYDCLGRSFRPLKEEMDYMKNLFTTKSLKYFANVHTRENDINIYRSNSNSIFQWFQLFEILIWGFEIEQVGIFSWTDHEQIYLDSQEYQKEYPDQSDCEYGLRYANQLSYYQYDEYDQPLNEIRTIKMSELTMEDLKHIPQHVLVYITKE